MSYPNGENHDLYEVPELSVDNLHPEVESGVLLEKDEDNEGEWVWCDGCGDARAVACVCVSIKKPHDEFWHCCPTCYEVYMSGVQHGRYHEAALHKTVPGRDSSQEKPNA